MVMARHLDQVSMLRESLEEYLVLAEIGINFEKKNKGVLGYPSATLLFAVVDAIGSYHRGDPKFTVTVDGEPKPIIETGDHVLILNSGYFGCELSEHALREIYSLMRSSLTHNAVVGRGLSLHVGEVRPAIRATATGVELYLPGFLESCKKAMEKFIAVADKVVPTSKAVADLEAKTRVAEVRRSTEPRVPAVDFGQSAQASAMGSTPRPPRDYRKS
jgi:hypothetical protein